MVYTHFLPFFETIENLISNYFYILLNLFVIYNWNFLP